MDKKENKFISVAYELFAIGEDGRHLVEKAPADRPFNFISGFGTTIEGFERAIADLEKDETFDFTLSKAQAYGDYDEERVVSLDREVFVVDGKFDYKNIFIDAIVPLQNEQGDRFMGRVIDIRDDKVVLDLNHPLAGRDLNFRGQVVDTRLATEDEIQQLIRHLTGEGCGGCGGCGGEGNCNGEGGGCDEGNCGNGGCGGCRK